MAGLRSLVVALLLTLGTLGGVSVVATQTGPSMTVHTVENTSNYLGPNASDVGRSGGAATSLDVAATVSAKAGEVRTTYTSVSLKRYKYERAESDAERRAVVSNGTDRLTGRVDALEQREVSVIDRYARGEIDEADLFRTLASIDAEARKLDETVEWLRNRATDDGMAAESRRLATLRIRLVALHGPIREDIRGGLDGTAPTRIHAETPADGGLLLATIVRGDDESTYVREAYTPSIRNRRTSNQYTFSEGLERLQIIYPWVTQGGTTPVTGVEDLGAQGARLYGVSYRHDHGGTTPYLDGGTGRVVRETQRLQVDRLPTESRNATGDAGDLLVTVETTYDTGPMAVTAIDNETDVSVDATVLIDGDRVAETGGGRAWAVDPRGPTNVTVVHDDETVTVDVPPA